MNARARQIDTLDVESEKKLFPSESSVSVASHADVLRGSSRVPGILAASLSEITEQNAGCYGTKNFNRIKYLHG